MCSSRDNNSFFLDWLSCSLLRHLFILFVILVKHGESWQLCEDLLEAVRRGLGAQRSKKNMKCQEMNQVLTLTSAYIRVWIWDSWPRNDQNDAGRDSQIWSSKVEISAMPKQQALGYSLFDDVWWYLNPDTWTILDTCSTSHQWGLRLASKVSKCRTYPCGQKKCRSNGCFCSSNQRDVLFFVEGRSFSFVGRQIWRGDLTLLLGFPWELKKTWEVQWKHELRRCLVWSLVSLVPGSLVVGTPHVSCVAMCQLR